jgi:cationic amino acid transporter 1
MGFLVDSHKGGCGVGGGGCFRSLIRRKQVDSVHSKALGHHRLAKELSILHLIAIGLFLFS